MTKNRIHILPESVKKQIAAGEVVEGPFSVIKELMENSLDAGASLVSVEVDESGLKRILVRDNGAGILREDLPLAVMEHSTSKIHRIDDIHGIITYGFRGEALSSISAISRLTLLSRSDAEETGGRIVCRDGKVETFDYAGPRGSTVIVENLFYNTPARKKFLKSRASEMKNIRTVFLKTALPHYGVEFSISADGRRVATLPATAGIGERIAQIYGAEALDGLESDGIQDIKVTVRGHISKPHYLKSTRSMQLLYVNNRPVDYRYLGFLLSRAYGGMIPQGRHPAAIIMIDIDPGLIDVNIHPAKREVKFFDQRYIDSLIGNLCRKILGEKIHSFVTHGGTGAWEAGGDDRREGSVLFDSGRHMGVSPPVQDAHESLRSPGTTGVNLPAGATGSMVNEQSLNYHMSGPSDNSRLLGIVLDHFILIQEGDSLIFIDFHAAHERIIYDNLMSDDAGVSIQDLMFPLEVDLGMGEYPALKEAYVRLSQIGFDIEDFSDTSVIIRGVPASAPGIDAEAFLKDLAEILSEGVREPEEIRKIIARRAACHSAKRTGEAMTTGDMLNLVEECLSGRHELRCPHGRPCVYRLEKNELKRIFKRA